MRSYDDRNVTSKEWDYNPRSGYKPMRLRNVVSRLRNRSYIVQPSPNRVAKIWPMISSIAVAFVLLLVPLFGAAVSAHAQTFTTLYSFVGFKQGQNPNGGLVLDPQGNLYGTSAGGIGQQGIVFEISPSNSETLLYKFRIATGVQPQSGLVRDSSGNFYGTTYAGGAHHNAGTIFELTPSGTETVLHSFANNPGTRRKPPDGFAPFASLVFDAQGNLYGTTASGGNYACNAPYGCGAVFKLTPSGTETLLYKFNGQTDGAFPIAPLIFDQAGNLYGTTVGGGSGDCGVVFKLTPAGTETVLYRFTCGADGGIPYGLIFDTNGNLYGTTADGGISNSQCPRGCGVVFKLTQSGTETVLYSFTGGPDGSGPGGSLVSDNSGRLYGAAYSGGDFNCGTLFGLTPAGSFAVLHTFTCGDGAGPNGSLILDNQGNLYGTTGYGGAYSFGTVFKLTP